MILLTLIVEEAATLCCGSTEAASFQSLEGAVDDHHIRPWRLCSCPAGGVTSLSTTCIGPKLVSGQEVAPFLCPVGSSWSLLWGGKKKSFAWAVVSEVLRHSGPFPSSEQITVPQTRDSGWGFFSAGSEPLLCPGYGLHLFPFRGATNASFLRGSLPLEWAVGSERMIRIQDCVEGRTEMEKRAGWWGAAFCSGFFSLCVTSSPLLLFQE